MVVKKKKRNGATIVALVILLIVVVGLLFTLTNGFSSKVKTFAVKRNGEELILNDKQGLQFEEEEKFEIINLKADSRTFSFKVYAYGDEESDFELTYGNERGYSWKEFAEEEQRDFTACFDIEITGNILTLRHEGFSNALAKYDSLMTLPDSFPVGDRFVLEILCGEDKISIGFSLIEKVTDIKMEPGVLVF